MNTTALWLAAGLLAGPSPQDAPKQAPASAQQTPEARIEALKQRFGEEQQRWYEELRAAQGDPEARAKVLERQPDGAAYAREYRAIALEAAGTPAAAKAWMEALRLALRASDKELPSEALTALLENHLDDPAVDGLATEVSAAAWQLGAERSEELLRELRAKGARPALKAAATFHLGTTLIESPGAGGEAERKVRAGEGRELLDEVLSTYASQPHPWGGTFGEKAEAWIFQLERLQPGMVAPDIEGTDLQGQPMRLADFRGQVVLLDFWGNW